MEVRLTDNNAETLAAGAGPDRQCARHAGERPVRWTKIGERQAVLRVASPRCRRSSMTVADVDLIVEAVVENADVKRDGLWRG